MVTESGSARTRMCGLENATAGCWSGVWAAVISVQRTVASAPQEVTLLGDIYRLDW